MSQPVKPEREPRFSPLGELLLGVGMFIGGWIVYGIALAFTPSFAASFIGLLGGIASIVGLVLAILGTVHVVRGRNARQQLADHAAQTIVASGQTNELDRLAALHRAGSLSDAEFAAAKKQLLGL